MEWHHNLNGMTAQSQWNDSTKALKQGRKTTATTVVISLKVFYLFFNKRERQLLFTNNLYAKLRKNCIKKTKTCIILCYKTYNH